MTTGPTPNPDPGIQKTFSAGPCSFSFKELWFAEASRPPASNLPLTHGTVESLSKLFSTVKGLEERGRLQSVPRAFTNPFLWLTTALLKFSSGLLQLTPEKPVSHHS